MSRIPDHTKGSIEYLGTVRGNSDNAGSLATLITWLEEAGLRRKHEQGDEIRLQYTKAFWSVKDEKHVEFDLYNTSRHQRFQTVIPHRIDTDCHRQRVGVLLYALVMSGYSVDVYKNDELKDVEFSRQLDWQI
ncbi:hypothetical protein KY363_02940 [Candidatus Woesearchaeota archaeon]|nr:hypothetical protein [Candidatus Woesearchaeota archaeon]